MGLDGAPLRPQQATFLPVPAVEEVRGVALLGGAQGAPGQQRGLGVAVLAGVELAEVAERGGERAPVVDLARQQDGARERLVRGAQVRRRCLTGSPPTPFYLQLIRTRTTLA